MLKFLYISVLFFSVSAIAKTSDEGKRLDPNRQVASPGDSKSLATVPPGRLIRVWDSEAKVLCYVVSGSIGGTFVQDSGGGVFCMPRKSLSEQ